MNIPDTYSKTYSRQLVSRFGGINRTAAATEGELYDCRNLCSDFYPAISPRRSRNNEDMRFPEERVLLAYNDGLIELWSQSKENDTHDVLYYKGEEIAAWWEEGLSETKLNAAGAPAENRCAVNMGTKTIFFPSKLYFDTKDGSCGRLEKEVSLSSASVYFCFEDLGLIENTWGNTFPLTHDAQFPSDSGNHRRIGARWNDSSNAGDPVFYKFPDSGDSDKTAGSVINTVYYRFEASSAAAQLSPFEGLRVGDWVTLDACEWKNTAGSVRTAEIGIGKGFWIKDIGSETSDTIRKDYVILGNNDFDGGGFINLFCNCDNYDSELSTPRYRTLTKLKISRNVPDVAFACVKDNRIWGVDTTGHQIYASYQGDPFVWNNYEATSMASYFATVGEGGDWTGICECNDHVYAFKRDMIFDVSGDLPSNFAITRVDVPGAHRPFGEFGDWSNIAPIAGAIYYPSSDGVYSYYGGYSTKISEKLGAGDYVAHSGFAWRQKYYISMKAPGDDSFRLYVYDTVRGTWHIEDERDVVTFARSDTDCYFCELDDIMSFEGNGWAESGEIEWSFDSVLLRSDEPDRKYISKIQIACELEEESSISISLQYDDDGEWHERRSFAPDRRRTLLIPVLARRCDSIRVRITGSGPAKIYSISYYYRKGSEY